MKKLFLLLMVVLLLSSCTESESKQESEAPIIPDNSFYLTYYYNDSADPITPSITLDMLRGTYSFCYSGFSSFLPNGDFKLTDDKLYLWTNEAKTEAYVFDVTEEGYVFDAASSAFIPTYKVSGDSDERYSPVPDGALFRLSDTENLNLNTYGGYVKRIGSDERQVMSYDDTMAAMDIVMDNDWQEGVTDCVFDCQIILNGFSVKYHSSCGAMWHVTSPYLSRSESKQYSFVLSDEKQKELNTILEKYISLGEDVIP